GLALRPARVLHDHPRGVAVEARIVGQHRGEIGAVELDVARAPRSRHDDDRADVAELAGDALAIDRRAARLVALALGADAEDDRIVRLVRSGDVDLVDPLVVAEIRALRRSTVDAAEEPTLDQRPQRPGAHRSE